MESLIRALSRPMLLWVLLLALLAAPASAAGEGLIEGKVVNGTASAGVPTGARVTLYSVRDRAPVADQSQPVDAQGGFQFSELDTDPGLSYLLLVDYHGIVYPHPQLIQLAEQPRQQLEPVVFEVTRESTDIVLERSNMLVTGVDQSQAYVMEMGAVSNRGDRTYIGDEQGVLRFQLPAGATGVVPEAGISQRGIETTPGGLVTRDPIPPGRHQIAIRYTVPLSGSVLDLSKQLTHPVESMSLYLPSGTLKASSPQLLPQGGGAVEMGGGRFDVYSGAQLQAGTDLQLRVSGLAAGSGELSAEQKAAVTLGGALLLAALVLLLVARLRRPAAQAGVASQLSAVASAESAHPGLEPPEAERSRLVRELAELDQSYESGRIPDADYHAQRRARKERLLSLVRQLEQFEPAEA